MYLFFLSSMSHPADFIFSISISNSLFDTFFLVFLLSAHDFPSVNDPKRYNCIQSFSLLTSIIFAFWFFPWSKWIFITSFSGSSLKFLRKSWGVIPNSCGKSWGVIILSKFICFFCFVFVFYYNMYFILKVNLLLLHPGAKCIL